MKNLWNILSDPCWFVVFFVFYWRYLFLYTLNMRWIIFMFIIIFQLQSNIVCSKIGHISIYFGRKSQFCSKQNSNAACVILISLFKWRDTGNHPKSSSSRELTATLELHLDSIIGGEPVERRVPFRSKVFMGNDSHNIANQPPKFFP